MSTSSTLREKAHKIELGLLPAKSREQYQKEYNIFKTWLKDNSINEICEDAVLLYVHELSTKMKPSSVWSKYSMVKSTLSMIENIHIEKYSKVIAFLKRNSVGYEPKKSKVLSRHEINKFLTEAGDDNYLMIKVALLIGICGACRREELYSLRISDIIEKHDTLIITLCDTKTNKKRIFTVCAEGEVVNPFDLYHKYLALRPKHVTHDFLFVSYRRGKCSVQRVGIHSFGRMPRLVAEYLKLPNPEMYTGHCFRRSSATLVADAGAELVTVKRLGGWQSSSVAEGYIEDSIEKKKKVSKLILGEKEAVASTSTSVSSSSQEAATSTIMATNIKRSSGGGFSFAGDSFKYAENCHFHFHV